MNSSHSCKSSLAFKVCQRKGLNTFPCVARQLPERQVKCASYEQLAFLQVLLGIQKLVTKIKTRQVARSSNNHLRKPPRTLTKIQRAFAPHRFFTYYKLFATMLAERLT